MEGAARGGSQFGRRGRLVLVCALVAALQCAPDAEPLLRPPQTIVLISIDTLRADGLGSFGAARGTSPSIDRLARSGVRFVTALAPSPWTIPSHASLMTSLDPMTIGATAQRAIPKRATTLAEILRDAGWRTAAIINAGYLDERFGFEQGFDEFRRLKAHKDAPESIEAALAFLGEASPARRFLFLHLYDVHGPYDSPPPWDGRFVDAAMLRPDDALPFLRRLHYHDYLGIEAAPSVAYLRAQYDAGIARVDAALGRLFDALAERGLDDEALIVVLSDHGESFFEHEIFVGHGLFLYDDELRIPLIVRFPAAWQLGGLVVDTPVSLVDVLPTIVRAAGLPAPGWIQGSDLLPLARAARAGRPADDRLPVFGSSSNLHDTGFVRTAGWKYIEPMRIGYHPILHAHLKADSDVKEVLERRIESGAQLYDLARDPSEARNLAQSAPQLARRFRAALDARRHVNAALRARLFAEAHAEDDVELDETERKKLRALGYAH